MIARLRGVLIESAPGHVVIDVGGVGYLALCSGAARARLPEPGAEAELRTQMRIVGERPVLYGFWSADEMEAFDLLQTVQGVGAKMALAILGTLEPDRLHAAIRRGDAKALGKAPGVGPKIAGRIVGELKGRVPAGSDEDVPGAARADADEDAVSALVNLGYPKTDAAAAAAAARASAPEAPLALIIRDALKRLRG